MVPEEESTILDMAIGLMNGVIFRSLLIFHLQSHDNNSANVTVHDTPTQIQPYSLYNELRIKIKQALVCHAGKGSPSITIDMGFDYLLFKGGLAW